MTISKLNEDQESARMRLYRGGASDTEIARELGIKRNTVVCWRISRGLGVVKYSSRAPGVPAENAIRALLYSLGWGDRAIAKDRGVHRNSIKIWRRTRRLPPAGSLNWRRRPKLQDVRARIRRAIGSSLPADIADDATSSLFLAVIQGEIPIAEIESNARRFGNRAIEEIASRFGPRSLDEQIGDGEGFTLLDTIRDENQSDWLEEMGATVW